MCALNANLLHLKQPSASACFTHSPRDSKDLFQKPTFATMCIQEFIGES